MKPLIIAISNVSKCPSNHAVALSSYGPAAALDALPCKKGIPFFYQMLLMNHKRQNLKKQRQFQKVQQM